MMATDTTPVRNDALARATALANRARELRRAQSEVQELTAREVQVLARTAAAFFDSIPLVEFMTTLLPPSARGLRRIRHRILHRTIHSTAMGTLIRALLLGRDGNLRLFSARSADSRDLLLIMEPGRALPVGVMRDVVDWTPTLRVPGFRPFEILDRLSQSLDTVEEQIEYAEHRVQVQRAALESGDLSALLPGAVTAAVTAILPAGTLLPGAASAAVTAILPAGTLLSLPAPLQTPAVVLADPSAMPGSASHDPFDMFAVVEAVAAAAAASRQPESQAASDPETGGVPPAASVATHDPRFDPEADAEEWDDPVDPAPIAPAARRPRALFPPMPPPR